MHITSSPLSTKSSRSPRRSRLLRLGGAALVGAVLVAACGGDDSADSPDTTEADPDAATETTVAAGEAEPSADDFSDWKVVMILDGSSDDGGWNTSKLRGGREIPEEFPGIDFSFVEAISPGQSATNAFEDAVDAGADMVIGTTYYQPDMMEVAAANPDVIFLTWAGFETAENVGHYDGATEDGRYIDGMIAGMLTESNIIGYPVGFPLNEVNRALNAFTLGALEVNPDVEVRVVYVNTWFDPAIEQQAAESLMNAGADVLAHEVGAPVYPTVAAQNDGFVIGYTNDWSEIEPEAWASSFLFNWGPYYIDQVRQMIEGTWTPELAYGGLADDFITFAPFGPAVTDEMLELVEERTQSIIDGSFDMFAGPIMDNEGNVAIAEGETVPFDERIECCQWLVEGVIGQIPG